jgi:zinc and cadmium transporter
MQVWLYTITSVIIVSALSLIGVVTFACNKKILYSALRYLVSFAVGALFGDAFIHLLPESFEKLGANLATSLYVIVGILIFFVLEKFIRWRHCHVPTSQDHLHPVVALNLIGDGVHNFIDGMVIAASYLVSIPVGVATTLAVVFHEIPQEFGDFGVLVNGGLSAKKALFFNFLSALTSIAGGIFTLLLGTRMQGSTAAFLPITAGGFIYIAGSDLIPELHEGCDIKASQALLQFLSIVLGVLVMVSLTFLER